MTYNIGGKVTGKEWNDGHPGKATNSAACFDGWSGMFERKPDTVGVEVHHDLGVDINYIAHVNGGPVEMGPPGSGKAAFKGGPLTPADFARTPGATPPGGGKPPGNRRQTPEKGGAPPGMAGILAGGSSAGMSIHKSEGLVPINNRCASNIPGLYAAGDALGSYMAGAIYTQVSSSLADSAVQVAVAGTTTADYCKTVALLDDCELAPPGNSSQWGKLKSLIVCIKTLSVGPGSNSIPAGKDVFWQASVRKQSA